MSRLLIVLLLLPLSVSAAVPAADAGTSPLWGLVQVMLALGLVLAVIVGAAWLFRRVSMGGMLGRWQPAKVVSGVMVGPHERVVIVELEGQWLVLGVTAKQVNLLTSMARPEGAANAATVPANTPPFAEWLAAALAKHRRPSSNDTP